jgi:hypothetical protein
MCIYIDIYLIGLTSTYEGKHATSEPALLHLTRRFPVLSIYCKQHSFILIYGWIILYCVYIPHFLNLYINCRMYELFKAWLLWIVLTWVCKWLYCILAYIPLGVCTGSHGRSIFSFLRNLNTASHSGCANLFSYQQWIKIAFPLHPCQHLLLCDTTLEYCYNWVTQCWTSLKMCTYSF